MKALEAFVQEGGVLIAEGTAATLFPEYRLVPGVSIDQPEGLFAPGSVMKVLLGDKTSPILYGYDQNAMGAMYKNGPILSVAAGEAAAEEEDEAPCLPAWVAATCSRWRRHHG